VEVPLALVAGEVVLGEVVLLEGGGCGEELVFGGDGAAVEAGGLDEADGDEVERPGWVGGWVVSGAIVGAA